MSEGRFPRDTTRQADGILHGAVARLLHRVTGVVIVAFVLVHVVAQAIYHVPALAAIKAGVPPMEELKTLHWIHAVLYFSIVFHTLYGLKLLVLELGAKLDYRNSLWAIVGVSALFGIREIARYAGI